MEKHMATKYTVAMSSILGTRDEQQDSAFYHSEDGCVFAVVCDGMGGLAEGQTASFVALEKLKELFFSKNKSESYPNFFLRAVDILDESILRLKSKDGGRLSAGTTVVSVVIDDDKLFWLSAGDSRLYLLRGREIVRVTRDHNYFLTLNQLKEENHIDQERYATECLKGDALISFIGMGGIQVMDINEKPFHLLQGDTILLTSDGLYKALPDEEILRILSGGNVEKALDDLIARSVACSTTFQDNTTCVVIRCG
jgi:protein phosphatase